MPPQSPITIVLIVVGLVALLAVALVVGSVFNIWIQARLSGVPAPFTRLVRMSLKREDVPTIVIASIRLHKAGAEVHMDRLAAHSRAGGNVPACVTAVIAARTDGRDLPWDLAAEADLAGLEVVQLTAEALGRAPQPPGRSPTELAFCRAIAPEPDCAEVAP
jgi:uncharacterized protein YqfA (UPF0365 family)